MHPWSHVTVHVFSIGTNLDKVVQKYIKPSLLLQHKQTCKDYKNAKTMDDTKTKYHVIHSEWLLSGVTTNENTSAF